LINSDIGLFFENLSRKNSSLLNSDKNNGTLHEDRYTFMIISRSVLLKREVLDKIIEEIKTYLFLITFPKIVPFIRQCGKILYSRTGYRWQYDSCVLHTG